MTVDPEVKSWRRRLRFLPRSHPWYDAGMIESPYWTRPRHSAISGVNGMNQRTHRLVNLLIVFGPAILVLVLLIALKVHAFLRSWGVV